MLPLIKVVPIPAAGVALGLAALGNLLSPMIFIARPICGVLSAILLFLLTCKVIVFPDIVKEDLKNPIMASVSATYFMAIMQLSSYIAPFSIRLAMPLWVCATAMHLFLMIRFSLKYFRDFKLDQVFPTFFICYVGIIVAAAVSPSVGMEVLGLWLFWIGFACYPVLFALITLRYMRHSVGEAARPLFCIFAAPASLSIVGYLAVVEEPEPVFVSVMLIIAQAMFLIALVKVPGFIKSGFYPSYAAMTFPFVISATALSKSLPFLSLGDGLLSQTLDVICGAEMIFAAVMVAFVLFRYIDFLIKKSREESGARSEAISYPVNS